MKRVIVIFALITSGLMITPLVSAEESIYSDPAKIINIEPCEDFTITLESNKTTGFGWDIAVPIDDNVIKFVSCEYVAASTGLAGSGGREIWSFRAACPGKASIAFKYFRPWEKDVPPARRLTFNVVVKMPLKDQGKQEDGCSDQR